MSYVNRWRKRKRELDEILNTNNDQETSRDNDENEVSSDAEPANIEYFDQEFNSNTEGSDSENSSDDNEFFEIN